MKRLAMHGLAIFLVAGLGLIRPAHGEDDRPKEIVISSFAFPPLLHLAEDGSFSGTMGETVKAICESAGIACSFRMVPLARAYRELEHGLVDALITIDLGQFKDCCAASEWRAEWSAGLFSTAAYADIPDTGEKILGRDLIVVNGMQSPYAFLPNMDDLAAAKKIKLFKAKDVETAVRMFANNRADLLWGGEDFLWHLRRINPGKPYAYRPLFRKDVILWVHHQKADLLGIFNKAYQHLAETQTIGRNGLLAPDIMRGRYKPVSVEKTIETPQRQK